MRSSAGFAASLMIALQAGSVFWTIAPVQSSRSPARAGLPPSAAKASAVRSGKSKRNIVGFPSRARSLAIMHCDGDMLPYLPPVDEGCSRNGCIAPKHGSNELDWGHRGDPNAATRTQLDGSNPIMEKGIFDG